VSHDPKGFRDAFPPCFPPSTQPIPPGRR